MSEKAKLIASFALCGFANFSSIGIQIGGIGGLAPTRKADLARLGFRALLGGSLATFMTATIAGLICRMTDAGERSPRPSRRGRRRDPREARGGAARRARARVRVSGAFAEGLTDRIAIPYEKIPHFPDLERRRRATRESSSSATSGRRPSSCSPGGSISTKAGR